MRRLAAIAAFALLLAVPLWAQHGGGGHSGGGGHAGGFGGGHGSVGGGHAGGFGGGHASSRAVLGGMHSGAGSARGLSRPSYAPRGFSNRGFSNHRFSGRGPFLHDGFRGNRFRTYGFLNNCYGYGCGYYGYPLAYGGFYDPNWYWDSGSSDDADYDQSVATAADMNRQNLEEQRMLRQEEADGDQDAYAPLARAPRPVRPGVASEAQSAAIMPNTVLVFRDQHREEISNYAIVGQTVYNFTPQRTERIPLASLDLVATAKTNQDLGVTFRVPGASDAP
jgi:hypothetical protein